MKKFRIRFNLGSSPAAWDTNCQSPITALNQFHRHVQRDLVRKPDEYTITRLTEVYNGDASGRTYNEIESSFDLPSCQNPDVLRKDLIQNDETEKMPWA